MITASILIVNKNLNIRDMKAKEIISKIFVLNKEDLNYLDVTMSHDVDKIVECMKLYALQTNTEQGSDDEIETLATIFWGEYYSKDDLKAIKERVLIFLNNQSKPKHIRDLIDKYELKRKVVTDVANTKEESHVELACRRFISEFIQDLKSINIEVTEEETCKHINRIPRKDGNEKCLDCGYLLLK